MYVFLNYEWLNLVRFYNNCFGETFCPFVNIVIILSLYQEKLTKEQTNKETKTVGTRFGNSTRCVWNKFNATSSSYVLA